MNGFLDPTTWAILFSLVGAVVLVAVTVLRKRKRIVPELREIAGVNMLRDKLARAAERGSPLHIALGSGELGGTDTVSSLAGLHVLEGLVDEAVSYGVAPVVTVGDATLLPLAQDALRRAYRRHDTLEFYDPTHVRFVAPSSVAYAAGAVPAGAPDDVAGIVAVGAFGSEVSLLADASDRRGIWKAAAVDAPQAIGALHPATEHLAVGEELYAAGAQLTESEEDAAGLITQDILRFLLALTILGLAAATLVAQ